MPLNNLRDWDTSGQLSPYPTGAGSQGMSAIAALLKIFQQQQQDKALRTAAGGMMGGTQVPQGVDAGKLFSELALEKNKAFAPQAPNETQTLLDYISKQGGLSGVLSNATQEGTEMPGTTPAIPPVSQGAPSSDMLMRGLMSKKFGVPYESMATPEEKAETQQTKLEQSPFYQNQKNKRTEELISTSEQGKVQKDMIAQAQEATGKIPTGLGGRMKMWWNRMFDPENPVMAEWQKIKMVLTDAQLMNTAKTKGAISDREMALFARAAANDDIASIQAMKPVFDKLIKFIDAEKSAKTKSYKAIYKEDPSEFLGADDPLGIR